MPNPDRSAELSPHASREERSDPDSGAQGVSPSRDTGEQATAWCAFCSSDVTLPHECGRRAEWIERLRSEDEDGFASPNEPGTGGQRVARVDPAAADEQDGRNDKRGAVRGTDSASGQGRREEVKPASAQIAAGQRVSEEGGPPTPSAAANPDASSGLAIRESDLLAIERVADALERCVTFDEFRDVRDTATLLQGLYRQRKASLASQNRLAEVRLRTERRLGEILRALKIRRGRKSEADPADVNPALSEIQVTEKESSVWQRLAKLDAEEFEQRIAEANINGIELRTAFMLRGPPPASMQRANDLAAAAERAQAKPALPGRIEDVARLLLASFTRDDLDRLGRIIAGGAAKDEREAEEDAA